MGAHSLILLFLKSNICMRKILSVKYSAGAITAALLALRLGSGILMMHHGYDKLVHFSSYQSKFMNLLGIGSTASLSLVIFAEFFCALFIAIGLFTRLATIPLIIAMGVALFSAHNSDFFGKGEMATLYLCVFVALLITGPGKASVDGIIGK
jgi:putative oxidoreductase